MPLLRHSPPLNMPQVNRGLNRQCARAEIRGPTRCCKHALLPVGSSGLLVRQGTVRLGKAGGRGMYGGQRGKNEGTSSKSLRALKRVPVSTEESRDRLCSGEPRLPLEKSPSKPESYMLPSCDCTFPAPIWRGGAARPAASVTGSGPDPHTPNADPALSLCASPKIEELSHIVAC
jgi:hypothetical protein